jgi:hypothetical protein
MHVLELIVKFDELRMGFKTGYQCEMKMKTTPSSFDILLCALVSGSHIITSVPSPILPVFHK